MANEMKHASLQEKDNLFTEANHTKDTLIQQSKAWKESVKAAAKSKKQIKTLLKSPKQFDPTPAEHRPNMTENLKKATTEMLVLLMLRKQNMYAYEMIQHIANLTNNVLTFNTLYIAIYRLRDHGLLQEQEKVLTAGNRTRVYFAITPEGERYLQESITEYLRVTDAISALL